MRAEPRLLGARAVIRRPATVSVLLGCLGGYRIAAGG